MRRVGSVANPLNSFQILSPQKWRKNNKR